MSEKKPIVLLVDDKKQFLETLSERVGLKGFETLEAENGAQALELAAGNEIDLAVVDLKLPDMDGLELITKLKREKPGLETLLLTGYGSDKLREASEALNTTYFEKQDMSGFWAFLGGFTKRPAFLIVDDEESFLDTVSQRVLLKGYEVHTATSGEEALKIAEKETIDYAVVDLKLGDMDGLVLITRLKSIQPGMQTMLLTAFGSDKLREATKALNTEYFEKQDMGGFWSFLKKVPRRLEKAMAAAGMATGGDIDDAEAMDHEKD